MPARFARCIYDGFGHCFLWRILLRFFQWYAVLFCCRCRLFSAGFYVLYITAGLSDMLDGFVARKTKTASEAGAKLDSAADLMFAAVCLIKILPRLQIRLWLWLWIAVIAIIKLTNIISGMVLHKKIIMLHTVANKITGLLLFAMPLFVSRIALVYLAVPVCAAATFAAVHEGHYIRKINNQDHASANSG